MARSTYVYLMISKEGYPTYAGTVKYEMARFIRGVPETFRDDFSYWRIGDGTGTARRARVSWQELLED